MTTCPALSPETSSACVLPDTREAHRAGHESAYVNGARAAWATTVDDLIRWGATVGIGRATTERRLLGKVHALPTRKPPTAKRNRLRSWTGCGVRLDHGWPFEATPVNACRKCYPDLAAPRFPDL